MTDMPASLAEALAALQTRLPAITKSERATVRSDKGNYSYTYANLAGISAAVLPLLGQVGLSWLTKPTTNADGKFVLAYKLLHISGDAETGEYPLPASGTPQAIGGAITYARRYCLCAVTGVSPEDDDDDAAAASQQAGETMAERRQRRTAQRRTTGTASRNGGNGTHQRATDAAGAPPLPGEDDDPTRVSDPQLAKIHATFNDLGVSDKTIRRQVVSKILQRTIESTKKMSRDEAGRLIDELASLSSKEDGALLVADLLREEGDG